MSQGMIVALLVAVVAVAALVFARRGGPDAAPADGAVPVDTVFVFVKIHEPLMPAERGDRYEDPLDAALKDAGLGEVTGGGTQLGDPGPDGRPTVAWVGIDVDLVDLERGLPVLKQALRRLGAPASTGIEYVRDGTRVSETLGGG